MIGKFRKKPVVIEAIRFNGENFADVGRFMGGALHTRDMTDVIIHTLEGEMTASPGDWIIKGVKGELYPCKPDIFDQTYEKA